MLQVVLIAVFVAMFLRDGLTGPLLGAHAPGVVAGLAVGGMAAIALAAHVWIWVQGRRLDRGQVRALKRADFAQSAARVLAVGLHVYLVLGLGWLDVVRGWVGDLVLVDEVITAAPVLLVFIAGWWSMYPIDHRLREAALLHDLDQGRPVREMPARGAYVFSALRHQAALVLVPILCLLAWSETLERAGERWGAALPAWLPLEGVHIAGMLVMLAVMPVVMRRIWDTTILGPGPLRDRLESMCREQRVRVRELLVWRTHGTMINGAVMGLAGPLRYILLTDALLDHLPQAQVEAVTAHELGHIRRRHMPWLAVAALSGIILAGVGADWAFRQTGHAWAQTEWAKSLVVVGALLFGAMLFGFVSRRFEWQADAFAVQHLSGYGRAQEGRGRAAAGDGGEVLVTPEAVSAMSGALESVARLNQIPRERFSWRHGSIASRQRRLSGLVGLPARGLRADRHAAWVKVAAGAGLFAAGVVVGATVVSSGPQNGPGGGGVGGAGESKGGTVHREAPADEVRQDARHR